MSMTDPVADMLTRIRNAVRNYSDSVDVPASKMKRGIAQVLKNEGFIKDFRLLEDSVQGTIRIYLRYGPDGEKVINEITRVSKPGLRLYATAEEVARNRVKRGLGVSVFSTNKGILSDKECRAGHVGGEVLLKVW